MLINLESHINMKRIQYGEGKENREEKKYIGVDHRKVRRYSILSKQRLAVTLGLIKICP